MQSPLFTNNYFYSFSLSYYFSAGYFCCEKVNTVPKEKALPQ